jgi:hypothetical protein
MKYLIPVLQLSAVGMCICISICVSHALTLHMVAVLSITMFVFSVSEFYIVKLIYLLFYTMKFI